MGFHKSRNSRFNPISTGLVRLVRARLDTTTKPAVDSLSPRRRSGEKVRERGFQKSATIRWNEPLSPLVPRREREQVTSAMVGVSRCARLVRVHLTLSGGCLREHEGRRRSLSSRRGCFSYAEKQ